MKLYLKNTVSGLIPLCDDDYEKKRTLKIGEVYTAEIKRERNIAFHRKYFSLIACTWDCLNDEEKEFYRSSEVMRKTIEMCAGHCERIYSLKQQEFVDIPKSISFSSMDESEFQALYDNVKNVIFGYVLKNKITEKDFMEHLINF